MPSRADYAKIHVALKELGIDLEAYRALLWDRFKVESAKELADQQVADLLQHFRRQGWKPKFKVKDGRGGNSRASGSFINVKPGPAAAQQRKVLALWNALGYDVAKLHARVKKQFGVERFEWVTDHERLHVLITDLEARARRVNSPRPGGRWRG